MNQEKIGTFILECRKQKNLTQEQLANILVVSNRTISKWELYARLFYTSTFM